MFPPVWSPVLVLGLVLALDPVRLGIILLVISRPRPAQGLFVYWVGAMAASVPYMLVPLIALHVTPAFRSFAQHYATPAAFSSPTVRHVQIGIGVVALSIAAVMTIRFKARQRTQLTTRGATTSTPVPESNTATSQPSGRPQDAPTRDRLRSRRLRARIQKAWETGSAWPALMLGAASGPPPLTVLLVLTTILASGAAIGTQVSLALAWVVGMFAIVEVILVSHLAMPARTEAALRLLHDWILTHRQQFLTTMVAVIGIAMMSYGIGGIGGTGH
jgi:hypothetical protein